MALRVRQQLQQAQLTKAGNSQQLQRIIQQVTDAHLNAINVIGATPAIGTHRTPQVAHVVHGAKLQLLLHPVGVVTVVEEEGDPGGRDGELTPALGMGPCHPTIQKRGAGTEGQQQGAFAAHEPTSRHELFRIGNSKVQMHTGRGHTGTVDALNQAVIGIGGVGPLKAAAVPQAEATARQEGEITLPQPGPQGASGFQQVLQLLVVVRLGGRGIFQVAAIRLHHETRQRPGHIIGTPHNGAVGSPREHLHLKALQQQGGGHG